MTDNNIERLNRLYDDKRPCTDIGGCLHPLLLYTLPGSQQDILFKNVHVLEEIASAAGNDAFDALNYGVYALMKTKDGFEAVRRFAQQLQSGHSPWAACITASAPGQEPAPFFSRLMEEFDRNNSFAEWLTLPGNAAKALGQVMRWDEDEIIAWKGVFGRVGAWKKAADCDPATFPLSKEGPAFGIEIETRNHHETNLGYLTGEYEKRTPHTTDLGSLASHIENVKKYFQNCEGAFPPRYHWNMHFNMGLSSNAYKNWISKEPEIKAIAYLLLMPANPFERNVYRVKEDERLPSTLIKNATNNAEVEVAGKSMRVENRCPGRQDMERLEMKMSSVWAGTDVAYLMGCMQIMHLITQRPELIESFTEELNALYEKYKLVRPEQFEKFLNVPENTVSEKADHYESAAERFRKEARMLFAKYISPEKPPSTPPQKVWSGKFSRPSRQSGPFLP